MFRLLSVVYLIVLGGCGNAVDGVKPVFRVAGMAELDTESDAMKQGKEHFAAGHFGLAVKYFRLAVARNSVSIEALNGLAASYDQLARFDVAERYYRKALDLDPHSSQTLNNVGFSYYLQGKFDLAEAYLSDAVAVGKDDSVVLANRRLVAVGQASSAPSARTTDGDVKRPSVSAHVPDGTAVARPTIRIERTGPAVQTLVTKWRPELISMTAIAVDGGGASFSKFRNWPVEIEAHLWPSVRSIPCTLRRTRSGLPPRSGYRFSILFNSGRMREAIPWLERAVTSEPFNENFRKNLDEARAAVGNR